MAVAAHYFAAELAILAGLLLGIAIIFWVPGSGQPPNGHSSPALESEPTVLAAERPPTEPRPLEPAPVAPPWVEPESAAEEAGSILRRLGEPRSLRGGVRTVLVVDDEEGIRELTGAFLSVAGYDVLGAGSGAKALALCAALEDPIDLLVTDVRMPGMGGPELHRRLVERYPDLPVLFMSGFASEWTMKLGVPEDAPMIEKGFTPDQLQARVRAIIGDPERRPRDADSED